MEYLVHIAVLEGPGSPTLQGDLQTSHIESSVNSWLDENRLPRLYQWKWAAQSGSNAPSRRGVLNTVHYDLPRNPGVTLILDVYKLVPVDPVKERLL